MGSEELLAILALILAIIAFVSEKNRSYLILKFAWLDYFFLIIVFLVIHYLISFDWLLTNWWKGLEIFTHELGMPSAAWAYIVTILALGYLCYKIFFDFFPKNKLNQVINYYKRLNFSSEHAFLTRLVDKFHKKDILNYLEKVKSIETSSDFPFQQEREFIKKYNKVIDKKRLKYAGYVFSQIVTDESFLDHTVNLNPHFFTDFFPLLNDGGIREQNFIKKYLRILIDNKNYHFFREVKNTEDLKEGNLDEEYPILRSLLADISVAEKNFVWMPIAESAIVEVNNEARNSYSFLREQYDSREDARLWDTRIMNSIQFFDIMVREAISQKATWHMWLFYYHRFIEALLGNIPEGVEYSSDLTLPTINHHLINLIFSKQREWLDVAHDHNVENLVAVTCVCLGRCLYEVSSSKKLSQKTKVEIFNSVLWTYFKFTEKENSELQISRLESVLKSPIMGFDADYGEYPERRKQYIEAFRIAWDQFDKIPYQVHKGFEPIPKFENAVLKELGI